jgi:hypothetical protein
MARNVQKNPEIPLTMCRMIIKLPASILERFCCLSVVAAGRNAGLAGTSGGATRGEALSMGGICSRNSQEHFCPNNLNGINWMAA